MGRKANPLTPRLIDPSREAGGTSIAVRYAAAFAEKGVHKGISNAGSRMLLAQCEGHDLPITVDDGHYGLSYVANPHSAYVLYARREIELVNIRQGRHAMSAGLTLLDRVLRWIDIGRIVHVDNWLLSTNLHGQWRGEGLPALRALLSHRFPDHFLALRSVDIWSSPELLKAARDDGWTLLPARQIWVVDDLARQWRSRNNAGNDRRALARSGLQVERLRVLPRAEAERIAELYRQLYIEKYSSLNPLFTPEFIMLTHAIGMIDYRVARDPDGRIQAVAGMTLRDGVMTPTVVGYDTSRPSSEALYRIACYMFCEAAEQEGWRLHGSAGAGDFKRARGARGVIEYMALYTGHLPPFKRWSIRLLGALLERCLVPVMQKEGW